MRHKTTFWGSFNEIYAGIRITDSINETILCFNESVAAINGSRTKGLAILNIQI